MSQSPKRPSETATWRGHARNLLLHGFFIVSAVAVALSLTVRDRFVGASAIYYSVPLPLASLVCAALGFAWWKIGKRRLAKVQWTLAVMLGAWLGWGAWQPREVGAHAKETAAVRILVWDVGAGRLGTERLATAVAERTPDVAVILQPGTLATDAVLWGHKLPEHTLAPLGEDQRVALLVRGSISGARVQRVEGSESFVATCRIETTDAEFDLVVADLAMNVLQSHDAAFRVIEQALAECKRPAVLTGGFRVPRQAAGFDRVRAHLQNAYESAGAGPRASFPMPLPLWEHDHVWADRSWRVAEWSSPWTTCALSRPVLSVLTRRD
ncbi:MAG: hypothetical protein AB7O52_11500 [Planctomycetota bacterium]